MRIRHLVVLLAALALLASACGDDGSSSQKADPVSYAERGPYAVGELELELDPEHKVAVFYPVDPAEVTADAEPYSYSGDDLFEPAIVDLLPGSLAGTIAPDDTWVGLPASGDGPFPVVLHSHGAAGAIRFANIHNAHTASWGNVVVVVDHPERGVVAAVAATASSGDDEDEERDFSDAFLDTEQLLDGLDLALSEAEAEGSPIEGALDDERVAAEGHSAGGSASGAAAYDERVDLWIGQAPGGPLPPDTDFEQYLVEEEGDDGEVQERLDTDAIRADTDPPDVPSIIIAAQDDAIVELDGVEETYEWLASPKRLAVIAGSGHAVFVDPCLNIREEGGLSAFVEALGIDAENVPLINLGEDGCLPEDTPPEEIWPLIDHLTAAQLVATFGPDSGVGEASLDGEYLDQTFPGLLAEYRSG
jgi:pimeloyl-ACP methyl ester carboxylesterase